MKRALVLGGGGVAGVAWEGGMLAGFAEGGVPLDCPDVIIGTSSGAFMGMRLAAGIPPDEIFLSGAIDVMPPLHPLGLDLTVGPQAFELWISAHEMDEGRLAEIGAFALQARTVTEAQMIGRTGARVGVEDWPAERLIRVTAVDVVTGRLGVFDRDSGEPMQRCISASVAMPIMLPPITVGDHRYMDGGVHSNSNADLVLADAPDSVVIIAPITERTTQSVGPLADRTVARELAALESAGVRTLLIQPNDQDAAAFGTNVMDPTCVEQSRERGYKRGLELAAAVTAHWRA